MPKFKFAPTIGSATHYSNYLNQIVVFGGTESLNRAKSKQRFCNATTHFFDIDTLEEVPIGVDSTDIMARKNMASSLVDRYFIV